MPTDLDVYAPERWVDDALFRPEVREAYRRLVAQGWTDALRALHPDERIYTFWKYFRNAFARDAGLAHRSSAAEPVPCRPPGRRRRRPRCAGPRTCERSRAGLDRTCGRKHRITAAGAAPEEGSIRLTLRSIEVAKVGGDDRFARNRHAGRVVFSHIRADPPHPPDQRGGTEWPAAVRPGKSPISNRSRRASRATPSSKSTFEVGRRFRCTMRIDCGQLDPGAVIRPEPGEWHPRMPERLDEEELADWRAGRNAVYQLAALTVGARLAVADA